ncbi:MAG: hypothetical protein WEB06_09650 [Actinomycetota bacterium]
MSRRVVRPIMTTRPRLVFLTLLILLFGCSGESSTPKPTRSPSPPTGLKGSASVSDPVGDVALTTGKALDTSADVRRIDLIADGSTLHVIVRFAKPLPPIDERRLECMFTMGVRDGLGYVLTFVRSTEAQPPTFWLLQGGFIDPNVTPERHPFTVFGDQFSAPVPVKLLDGLPPVFLWAGRCGRYDNASGSEDSVGDADTTFKGTT